jgi:hypothetical protein
VSRSAWRRLVLLVLAGGALVISAAALAACGGGAMPAGQAALRLKGAATLYYLAGPGDPVVEVRVFLENAGEATNSTSIAWDAEFGREFVFLDSEPKPWRVNRDGAGGGEVDTAGVLPRQPGVYRLWFAATTYRVVEPRLRVVANGGQVLGQNVLAEASHVRWQRPTAEQQAFERGPLAGAGAAATVLPADGQAKFGWALVVSLTLTAVLLAGGTAAFVTIERDAAQRLGRVQSPTRSIT